MQPEREARAQSPQGPGASSFATTLAPGTSGATLAIVNGLTVKGTCTSTTVELLTGSYPLAPVGKVVVRGKTMPVLIYRLDVPA